MPKQHQEFADLAARYCNVIEQGLTGSTVERAAHLARLVAKLYAAASALPDVWDARLDDLDESEVDADEYEEVFGGLTDVLDEYDYYWSVEPSCLENPYNEPEVTAGQLHDDLADIWRDLKAGLRTWERSSELDRMLAVWQWRLSFHGHWGYHAVDVLKVLHWIGRSGGKR